MATTLFYTAYQPLGWLAYALLRAAAGPDPAAFHAASLVCHAAVACAFFAALRRLLEKAGASPPGWTAFAGALLFCVHPLQAATVGWATELPDQLATLLFLLAVWVYLGGQGRRRLAAVTALYAASLLCRWKGAALPLILLALDAWPLGRLRASPGDPAGLRASPGVWLEKAPLLVLMCAAIFVNALAKTGGEYAPQVKPLLAARGLWLYPAKLLWPSGLTPLFQLHETAAPAPPGLLAAALAAATGAWLWLRRRDAPAPALAAFFYAACVAPPLLSSQRGMVFVFQHYAYLSCLPFFALAAEGLRRLARGPAGAAAAACLLAATAGVGADGAHRQAQLWGDSVKLWTNALTIDPQLHVAYDNLAEALLARGRDADAFFYTAAAVVYNPQDAIAAGNMSLLRRRHPALRPSLPEFWVRAAADELSLGRAAEAERLCAKALQSRPRLPEAHETLAAALAAQGRPAEAARHLAAARRWREAGRGGA